MSTALKTTSPSWTCARCEVTIRYMPGHEPEAAPAGWNVEGDTAHCLYCRRELAAEEGFASAPEEMPREDKVKLRRTAVVEFELLRDPDRTNGEIAKAVRCSVPAVLAVRRRLDGADS